MLLSIKLLACFLDFPRHLIRSSFLFKTFCSILILKRFVRNSFSSNVIKMFCTDTKRECFYNITWHLEHATIRKKLLKLNYTKHGIIKQFTFPFSWTSSLCGYIVEQRFQIIWSFTFKEGFFELQYNGTRHYHHLQLSKHVPGPIIFTHLRG